MRRIMSKIPPQPKDEESTGEFLQISIGSNIPSQIASKIFLSYQPPYNKYLDYSEFLFINPQFRDLKNFIIIKIVTIFFNNC